MLRPKRAAGRESGTAALELAFVFPVLAFMLLGMCEMSINFFWRSAMADAARHGARTGSVYNANAGENATAPAVTATTAYLTFHKMFRNPQPTVTAAVAGDNLTVTITRPRFKIFGLYPQATLSVKETLPLP